MQEEQFKRINELARKSKAEGLTPDELAEQAGLRRAYIDSVKASLQPQLESIRYVDADGNITMPGEET
jgi:uncharacterized protein YnzC (UPF0291/DUF896 family)